MTAVTFGNVLARKGTDEPERVWRCSFDEGDPRSQVAMPVGKETKHTLAFIDYFVRALKRWANETKKKGRSHEISQNAIYVAEQLLRQCTDFKTGRCTPCIETIMEKTRFARPTVVRLLALLREHKFLNWVRRTVKTGNAPGEGPQVKQTSNAYFIDLKALPAEVSRYLKQMLKGAIDLDAMPSWTGSGPVPPRALRLAGRLAARLSIGGRSVSADLADRSRQISSAAHGHEAEARWPDDPDAQQFFNEAMGIPSRGSASSERSLEFPLKNKRQVE